MAAQPPIVALPPLPPLPPPQTALLGLLLPVLAYIAYTLHALLASQRAAAAAQAASTAALLHELRDTAAAARDATAAVRDTSVTAAAGVEKELGRATRAVEKVAGAVEGWERRWKEENGGGSSSNNGNNGGSNGLANGHVRRGSAGSTRSMYHQQEDNDLYRRKVEAMEGLRRLMEAQPAPLVEDEDLYRRRVEALEGLRRVLEMQPGVQGYNGVAAAAGRKKVAAGRGGAVGGGGGMNFGAALSVRSEGRALKKERSAETLGESLLDL